MKIDTLEVAGFGPAIHGMRNPKDSWDKSDSSCSRMKLYGGQEEIAVLNEFNIGEADKALSLKLQTAGPEHCKHLRMIQVWADISAPRYWLTELDTYRMGVEKVSCSTMHKLMSRPLCTDDFEHDAFPNIALWQTIAHINNAMEDYKETEDPDMKKAIWRGIIQCLPQSYIQKRTYMFSYAALRNIYRQRQGHKLKEWKAFCDWVESLPESWMVTE